MSPLLGSVSRLRYEAPLRASRLRPVLDYAMALLSVAVATWEFHFSLPTR